MIYSTPEVNFAWMLMLLCLTRSVFLVLQEIHNMLKENNKVLKCSNASPDWRGYVDFVNNVVVDGLSRVICASLEYLLDQVRLKVQAKKVDKKLVN